MPPVASRSENRRRLLARRVAALETMEPRAMITEGLFSLSLGAITSAAALHGSLKAGAGHGTTHEAAKFTHRPRHEADQATVPKRKAHHGGGGGSGHHAAVNAAPKPAPATGDWLTLFNPAAPPASSAAPAIPSKGGGALGGGGGGGPDAAGAIRPVRFSPPQDPAVASSSVLAAAGPATGGGNATTPTPPGPHGPAAGSTAGNGTGGAIAAPPAHPSSGVRSALLPSGGALTPANDPGIFTVTGGNTNVAKGVFTNFPLYTLDYNDGVVLFPGDVQVASAGKYVDLRAQVRDTAVTSYSWDTTNLTSVQGIAGAATYDLTFQWITAFNLATTSSVKLTVTGTGGKQEIQTYTFVLPGGESNPGAGSGGSSGITWPETLAPNTVRPEAPAFASHDAAVDAGSGALDAAIPLPSYNPNVAPLALVYDSVAADPRPIVVEHHVLDPTLTIPTQVTASLTFNGSTGATSYTNTSQFIAGDVQQIALQAAVTVGTNRYAYTVNLADVRGTTTTSTASGTMTVLDESANAFGAGWTLAGLEKITTATGGVILSLGGGGRTLWFSGGGSGTYTSPAGEFSTLASTLGSGGTTYTRTLTDGTVYRFDSAGKETSVADRNGLRVTYAYDAGNRLTTITDPYANNTVLGYTSGLLATVTDPAGRVATFTHAGTNLTAATLPDSATWSYAYDSAHRLTTITDPNSRATVATYDAANRVGTITRPDATAETFKAYQERGFLTGSSAGSPGAATLLAESKATHTDPNGHAVDLRPDWRGMGLANQVTDPDGNVAARDRDANGLATISIDRLNRFTTYTYDAQGNVTGSTLPDTNRVTSTYNGLAEVLTATDANFHTTNYTYDGSGNLTGVQDALGDLTTMTYTANGRLATVKDPLARTTSLAYDAQDRLTTITYPAIGAAASALATFVYDSKSNVATVIDARGNATTHSYDALNRLTGTKDALGNRTTMVYDSGGNLAAVQAPLVRTTTYAYDAMDRIATVTDPLSHSTTLSYDSGGNLKTVTDALGRTTTFAYDPEDRRTVATTPVSAGVTRSATVTYDAEGQALQRADYLNRVTTVTYNARGWADTVTDPLGNVTTYTYSATGKTVTQSDPSQSGGGTLVAYGYDALDRLTTVTDALGHTDVTVYDSGGNVIATVDGNANRTTYAYDARNRLTTITDPLSHAAVIAYDSGGNRTSVTDPLSHTTTYGFDALNRVTTITDARSAVTTIAFDAAGRRVGLTDPMGNATTWAYDAADRMTTETAPVPLGVNGVSTYAYDDANQLTDKTDRDGRHTTFAYDLAGRQTNERWLTSSGGTIQTITYTYDLDNELTGATDPNATLAFTYDSGGRRTAAGTSGGGSGQPAVTLTYGYNQANQRTSLADSLASAGVISYAYDAAQRLSSIAQSFGGVNGPQVVYGYDSGNRVTTIARTIGGSGTEIDSTLAYDNANRLTTLTHQVSGGTVLASYAYAYDNANRLTTETYTGTTMAYNYAVTYAYDVANELTAAGGSRTESYGYDSGGNRNTTGYTTAAGNELTAAPGFTYTYDAQGDTTAQTETATGKVTTFSYDYRDRLTGATQKDSKAAVIMQATYTYDALNRRIGTNVDADGAGPGSPVQTWMVDDGQNTYADFNGSGTLLTRYLYGPAVDQLLARTSSGGTTAWYLTDQLGSVRDIASVAGSVIDHVAYASFGGLLSESTPASGDRLKFTARELDPITGLQSNRARYLNSGIGRWTQRDPIGFTAGDPNLFRYVRNGPTNSVDATGLADRPIPPPIPINPTTPPGPGWTWSGNGDGPEDGPGGWIPPNGGGSLHWDPKPHGPIGPHWDWVDRYKNKYRYDPDTKKWYPDERNNPYKPKPDFPPGMLRPPVGFHPNPPINTLPWWVPANADDDWKYNTGTVVGAMAIVGTGGAIIIYAGPVSAAAATAAPVLAGAASR